MAFHIGDRLELEVGVLASSIFQEEDIDRRRLQDLVPEDQVTDNEGNWMNWISRGRMTINTFADGPLDRFLSGGPNNTAHPWHPPGRTNALGLPFHIEDTGDRAGQRYSPDAIYNDSFWLIGVGIADGPVIEGHRRLLLRLSPVNVLLIPWYSGFVPLQDGVRFYQITSPGRADADGHDQGILPVGQVPVIEEDLDPNIFVMEVEAYREQEQVVSTRSPGLVLAESFRLLQGKTRQKTEGGRAISVGRGAGVMIGEEAWEVFTIQNLQRPYQRVVLRQTEGM